MTATLYRILQNNHIEADGLEASELEDAIRSLAIHAAQAERDYDIGDCVRAYADGPVNGPVGEWFAEAQPERLVPGCTSRGADNCYPDEWVEDGEPSSVTVVVEAMTDAEVVQFQAGLAAAEARAVAA